MRKRGIALAMAIVLLLASCAGKKEKKSLYEVSEELVRLLWEVDYKTFSADAMTALAKEFYEADYLEYYLEDAEYYAGVQHARQTQLVSSLLSAEDMGTERQTLEGVEYTVQKLKAEVQIDRFRPEYPEQNYFSEGERYCLIYQIYFVEQAGEMKISGFSFLPADGPMLPAAHRQPLSGQQELELLSITNDYLALRYQLDGTEFSAEQAWAFYERNAESAFLALDGISKESLEADARKYAEYGVHIRLTQKQLEAGEYKTAVYTGEESQYYYWVKAEYTYEIAAQDPSFFAKEGVAATASLTEMLYFAPQEDGNFRIAFAEYRQE